jgi:regulator of protease activity HflC (stomatin/prohibitin superfamily)
MQTDELLLRQLIASTSVLTLLVLHLFVLLYGSLGKRRGLRTAAGYLFAFDWALMMGVTAGRTVASDVTPFWSLHTMKWGVLGVLFLFLPVWLLFRQGLRFGGTFLLPVMPTQSKQRRQAGRTIRAYMWGLNYPFHREEDGELRKVVDGGISLHEGGPGFVMASSHYAIPLTVGTHDTQVGGYGLVFTGRKERPRSPVDLRLQVRAKSVHALTREGIPVKVMMFAVFEIDRRRAKGEGMYPFDSEAVFAAVHAQGVGPGQEEEREEIGWDQVVAERGADLLRDAIARTLLDRLLESESEGDSPPRETLRSEVAEELKEAMRPLGIRVLGVGLGNIEVEDEAVLDQRVRSWAARWERRRLEREAEGDAEATRLIEEARADAQRQMIEAITEAFQQLADTGTSVPPHVIALRFIDVLDEMATSPDVQRWLPQAARGVPGQLRLLMEPGSTGDELGDEGEATR